MELSTENCLVSWLFNANTSDLSVTTATEKERLDSKRSEYYGKLIHKL